ncbi:MAG TPA: recombinase family protein [Thermoleophilaceae bacterium]|nr:recombinase family protein [Thermoleophilaceae bacterium]
MVIDGYVRVSQVRGRAGERLISSLEQRAQIEGWARLHGAAVGEVFEELDESGARADRPLLERALQRIEAGTSHGLVVARLDRFGRSLIDGLAAIERIRRAGGTSVSVQDGFDLTTETGRLIMRIMLAMGEWQLDRVRSVWPRRVEVRRLKRKVNSFRLSRPVEK